MLMAQSELSSENDREHDKWLNVGRTRLCWNHLLSSMFFRCSRSIQAPKASSRSAFAWRCHPATGRAQWAADAGIG